HWSSHPRHLHSFPTRRSSDLIDSHKDLLWFGKVENYRYYSHNDSAVKNGQKRKGERKEGRQMHVQIIVSRKDITNKIKLSPQNTDRKSTRLNSSHVKISYAVF